MKHIFIINPASGKEKNKESLIESISSACEKKNAEFEIYVTKKPFDAVEYIHSVCSANTSGEDISFYACGGDGTFCEVVNGVYSAENNKNVRVGVMPVGTGNDFVKSFAPSDRFLDVDAQLDAVETEIDLIDCNGFCAANMINIGFDCEVVVKTAQIKRRPFVPAKMAYIFGLVLTLVKKPTVKMKSVKADGAELKENCEYLLTTFANGRFCGGGFNSNPYAELNDGKIDAMYINNIRRTKFLSLVGSYKSGTHICPENESLISNGKSEAIEIEFNSPTNVCIDGEIKTFDKITLSVKKKALKILVPKLREEAQKKENEAANTL